MTKEEIYEETTLKNLGNNPQGTRMDIVYSAMDEYAKKQSIAFAEWIDRNGYFQDTYDKFWYRRGKGVEPKFVTISMSNAELYTIFLSQQTQE